MPPNNQNNKENSVILHLESLNQQYDTLLIRYKEAISNYTNLVQQNNSPEKYSLIKGNSFWGSGQAGSQSVYTNVNNASGCQALCSKTTGCSGATFNPGTNGNPKCYLRSGNGSMVPSAATDYAIIPLSTEYLLNIQNLNQQLTEINNQIIELSRTHVAINQRDGEFGLSAELESPFRIVFKFLTPSNQLNEVQQESFARVMHEFFTTQNTIASAIQTHTAPSNPSCIRAWCL